MDRIETHFYWGIAITVLPREFCGSVEVQLTNGFLDGYICGLCVHPDERNQGHGRTLMAEAEQIIKEHGRNDSTLYVEKEFQWLVDWYRSQGYEIVENTSGDDHYHTMGKKLNDR